MEKKAIICLIIISALMVSFVHVKGLPEGGEGGSGSPLIPAKISNPIFAKPGNLTPGEEFKPAEAGQGSIPSSKAPYAVDSPAQSDYGIADVNSAEQAEPAVSAEPALAEPAPPKQESVSEKQIVADASEQEKATANKQNIFVAAIKNFFKKLFG